MVYSKKAKETKSSTLSSKSMQMNFKQAFDVGKKVADDAARRRESEVLSLAQIKIRF